MKSRLRFAAFVLTFSTLLFGSVSQFISDAQSDTPPVKQRIAAILPLSGEMASIGTAAQNGMLLALESLSKLEKASLELVFEDDQGQQKNTVGAYKKLTAQADTAAVITASSGTSNAVASLADRAKIPLIAIASDGAVSRGKQHVVNFWVTPETEAVVLLSEIKRRGYKSIAMVTATHDGTLAFRKAFLEGKTADLQVVFDQEMPVELKDFRTIISTIKSKQTPDAIFVNLFFGQAGIFARQTRELGMTQPLFAIELFEDESEVKNSNGALLGQWYIQADQPGETFLNLYKKRFPGASTFGAANGHDAILLIAAGLRGKQGNLNDYLHQVQNFSGALGSYSASGDNRFTLPATVKIVTKDGFVKASK